MIWKNEMKLSFGVKTASIYSLDRGFLKVINNDFFILISEIVRLGWVRLS